MKAIEQLDEVRWSSLQHAYGSAQDVPEQLRALRSEDTELRARAWSDLHGSLDHQGVHRGAATLAAVPFLIALVADASTPDRGALLRVLAELTLGDTWWFQHDGFHPEHQSAPDNCSRPQACSLVQSSDVSVRGFPNIGKGHDMSAGSGLLEIYQAIATGVPAYVELAGSTDADIRASTAYLLAWLTPHASTSAAALTRLCEDPVPTVRASAWLALSHATKFDPPLWAASIVRMKAAWSTVRDPLERRALALALVRTEDADASEDVRPHLRDGLENGLQPVIPDRSFPWRRIDTAPFVFCTTFIGTPPSDRREVITAGVRGLRHVHDEHDAADLAYWLLRVGAPKPDGDLGGLASELMLAIANNPTCWHFAERG